MTDEEQSGFHVVDKRHASAPAENPPSDAGPSAPAGEAAEPRPNPAEETAGTPIDLPRLTVRDRLLMCIDILHQGAWIAMGLIADPATGQIEKDMEGARIAIDSVAFLAEKTEDSLDEATRRELQNLVRDLRVNFVQQSNR